MLTRLVLTDHRLPKVNAKPWVQWGSWVSHTLERPMNRQRIVGVGSCILSVVLISTIMRLIPSETRVANPPEVTKINFDHIQFGMSLEEVNNILGPPFPDPVPNSPFVLDGEICIGTCWIGKDGQVLIWHTKKHGAFEMLWQGEDGTKASKKEFQ